MNEAAILHFDLLFSSFNLINVAGLFNLVQIKFVIVVL